MVKMPSIRRKKKSKSKSHKRVLWEKIEKEKEVHSWYFLMQILILLILLSVIDHHCTHLYSYTLKSLSTPQLSASTMFLNQLNKCNGKSES